MATELGWAAWHGFSAAAMEALEAYAWPGNVRELRNVVERAVYRWEDESRPIERVVFDPFESAWSTGEPTVPAKGPPPQLQPQSEPIPRAPSDPPPASLRAAVEAHERALIAAALESHRWNQRRTAAALGLTYDQLRHCMRKHGLAAQG